MYNVEVRNISQYSEPSNHFHGFVMFLFISSFNLSNFNFNVAWCLLILGEAFFSRPSKSCVVTRCTDTCPMWPCTSCPVSYYRRRKAVTCRRTLPAFSLLITSGTYRCWKPYPKVSDSVTVCKLAHLLKTTYDRRPHKAKDCLLVNQ